MTKKILLASVFKPFTIDDQYGRKECIQEFFHNQLTRYQGVFSPRQQVPPVGLHLIAANIGAQTTILEWPTLKRFTKEVEKGYDYVGISAILSNISKVRTMVEVVRNVSPRSRVILGGYVTSLDNIENVVDVDYICRGEGIRYMRNLLGESPKFQFTNPVILAAFREFMGIPVDLVGRVFALLGRSLNTATSLLVTGLGCTNGCEFCSTSHFFDCTYIPFMRKGEEIFAEMQKQERLYGITRFSFTGDDNFFIDRKRAVELHECVMKSGRFYNIALVFSSINFLKKFDPRFIAEIGVDKIFIGLESSLFPFKKNFNADIKGYVDGLKKYGTKVFLSTILGFDGHTQENVQKDIDYHISLRPTYSQFALLSVADGTPLYARIKEEGRILRDIPYEDRHGFKTIWFSHPSFSPAESERWQQEAYRKDYLVLGPSFAREIEVNLRSYFELSRSSSPVLRQKAEMFRSEMPMYTVLLRAAEFLVPTENMIADLRSLRREIEGTFGRMGTVRNMEALALALCGKIRKVRTRYFGDGLEPRTVLTHFNNGDNR